MKRGDIMGNKTANVMARVEPDIKLKAEFIIDQLGIPASVVINMLYKQIVLTKSIPFSLTLPAFPTTLDEMDETTFNEMMRKGLNEAKNNHSYSVAESFSKLKRDL